MQQQHQHPSLNPQVLAAIEPRDENERKWFQNCINHYTLMGYDRERAVLGAKWALKTYVIEAVHYTQPTYNQQQYNKASINSYSNATPTPHTYSSTTTTTTSAPVNYAERIGTKNKKKGVDSEGIPRQLVINGYKFGMFPDMRDYVKRLIVSWRTDGFPKKDIKDYTQCLNKYFEKYDTKQLYRIDWNKEPYLIPVCSSTSVFGFDFVTANEYETRKNEHRSREERLAEVNKQTEQFQDNMRRAMQESLTQKQQALKEQRERAMDSVDQSKSKTIKTNLALQNSNSSSKKIDRRQFLTNSNSCTGLEDAGVGGGINIKKDKKKRKQDKINHEFEMHGALKRVASKGPSVDESEKKLKRANRFAEPNNNLESNPSKTIGKRLSKTKAKLATALPTSNSSSDMYEHNKYKGEAETDEFIVGTCEDLEKRFLRQTARRADSATVRPKRVLMKSLPHVLARWEKANDKNCDERKLEYKWVIDQLKSIRQDLTVQGINDSFTVEVYECNARICAEMDDSQFRLCLGSLNELYDKMPHLIKDEFVAYKLLNEIYVGTEKEKGNLLSLVDKMDPMHRKGIAVDCALRLWKAYVNNDYVSFFRLYVLMPYNGPFIVDWFIEKVRRLALFKISLAYSHDKLSSKYVRSLLKMNMPEKHTEGREDSWEEFSDKYLKFASPKHDVISCKATFQHLKANYF